MKKEMPKPVDKIIDDEKYTFYYLSPRISYKIFIMLAKMVSPSIGVILDSAKGIEPDNDFESLEGSKKEDTLESLLDSEISLEKIIKLLCENTDGDSIQYIIDTLFEQAFHHGEGEVMKAYDKLFTGRILHLNKVLAAAIGVQYADFLAGKSVAEKLKTVADIAQGSLT